MEASTIRRRAFREVETTESSARDERKPLPAVTWPRKALNGDGAAASRLFALIGRGDEGPGCFELRERLKWNPLALRGSGRALQKDLGCLSERPKGVPSTRLQEQVQSPRGQEPAINPAHPHHDHE